MSTATRTTVARRALAVLDLTELGDDASDADVRSLCARAVTPFGAVAAVCVWPRHVDIARQALRPTPVRIATVTNFPSGAEPITTVVAQTAAALADGADEIDVVLPHRLFAAGDVPAAAALLDAVRATVPVDGTHLLKVILETGELGDPSLITAAAHLAIDHGADFVKTSTGKTPTSATLVATGLMLEAIRASGRPVGLKPSGGIRTIEDAAAYLAQADERMGSEWVGPQTFRFGASGLLTAILDVLGDDRGATPTKENEY